MGRNRILTWHFMWSYGDSNPGPLACHARSVGFPTLLSVAVVRGVAALSATGRGVKPARAWAISPEVAPATNLAPERLAAVE